MRLVAHLLFRKFGQHKDDVHYTRESTKQFDLKPVSDEHFKIRKIKLENQEYEIKEIPTIPFRVNEDPLSEENAFDGIYDMIDIMGDDPSVTPAQLCHGHKVYRAVDLGVSFQTQVNFKGESSAQKFNETIKCRGILIKLP